MKIEILGSGCRNCENLYANAVAAAGKVDFPVDVTKVADPEYFIRKGVFITPGLVIDGEVVSTGSVVTVEEIEKKIRERA